VFKPAIVLDADMSAAQVLERLAQHGIWTHPTAAPARAYLEAVAARVKLPVDDVAKTMGRDARKFGAAIRRQFDSRVLWYARELQQTLDAVRLPLPICRCATCSVFMSRTRRPRSHFTVLAAERPPSSPAY
jgi:hypothetical protein